MASSDFWLLNITDEQMLIDYGTDVDRSFLFIDDHMYQMVNGFLLLKPAIDTLNVPEFYKLFNSATVEVEK